MNIVEDVSRLLENHKKWMLALAGLVCLAAASTFHFTFLKVDVDHLLAEVGALLLVVGVLHFLFEMRLRRELLKEVAISVLGNERLHTSGLIDWLENSKDVKDLHHWKHANLLTVGVQYSPSS